uniref:sialoadhesin-like n=1 Tax=Semicossyphus pulcher TaxID=241346 RepID=UPI0037E918DB
MKAALLLLLLRIYQTSALIRPYAMVLPGSSQIFEYQNVSVNCSQFSSGRWTVWRYTSGLKPVLSQCGSGWGHQTSCCCDMNTIKQSDNGVYWCESNHRDSSNAINVTIIGGPVILQSPPLPVMPGDNVTLHCKQKKSDNLPAEFYKDDSLIGNELTGHMTIRNFSTSDQGAYKCAIGDDQSSRSWLLMEDGSDRASLTVSPDSSQLFEYRNLISLSCGDNSSSDGWRVIRATTSDQQLSTCGDKWGNPTSSGCHLKTPKTPDSATYWCESPARQRSNSVTITVHDGPVILQSPVLPVTPGDNVTLHCKQKKSDNLPADFYKDGSLIRTEPAGHMTLHHVSTSAEGLYRCHIQGHGDSPSSWLFVRDPNGTASSSAAPSVLSVVRHLVVVFLYLVCTVLAVSSCRHRTTGRNLPVSMTTSPPSEEYEGSDQPYNDATTEHHF